MGKNLRQQLIADVDRLRDLVVRYARGEASIKGACDTLAGAVQEKLASLGGETEAGSQVAEVKPKTARILIIADDEMIRNLLRQMLEQSGHQVEEAPDSRLGLSLYRRQSADLVVADIRTPREGWKEVIREFQEDGDSPGVRVVAVTDLEKAATVNPLFYAELLGAWRTIYKPFRMQTLLDGVNEALEEGVGRGESAP